MENYQQLIEKIFTDGEWKTNRTAQQTLSISGHMLEYNMRDGFPLLSLKYVPFNSVIGELVAFMRGCTNVGDFQHFGTRVWNDNAESDYWLRNPNNNGAGDLGRIYGAQWRTWRTNEGQVDQLQGLINGLVDDPYGRRHIVTAWNPGELDQMALPPCHVLFQCLVGPEGDLDLLMYQRSVDVFLGLPFNIASYSALLMYLGKVTGLRPRKLTMFLADCHLYENQMDGAEEVLRRESMPMARMRVQATPGESIDNVVPSQFILSDYEHHEAIHVPMVV